MKSLIIANLLPLLLLGCSSKSPSPASQRPGSTGKLAVGETSVWYGFSGNAVAVVVWSDTPGAAGGSTDTSSGATGGSGYITSHDQRLKINWENADGGTGKVTLGDTTYDLAKGAVFLVSMQDGKLSVVQHQHDLTQIKPTVEGFEILAKADPDIAAFVAAAGKKK
jgi:hypothetical protein